MDILKISKQFPVTGQYIYADTAGNGLLYEGLLDWRQEHDLDTLIGGSKMHSKNTALLSKTRKTVGTFFGCKPENVALVPNFSLGLNLLLDGSRTQQRVLLLDGDYPSVNWPFQSRDFKIFTVGIGEDLEERIHQAVKADAIQILALSLVQWVNGVKIRPDFLKSLKEAYPELIIIADGTQYCGTEPMHFEDSGIDVLGASCYKWLLGGQGNGFMLFSDRVASQFDCRATGFHSAQGNLDGYGTISFAQRFEPGHLDSMAFGSLNHSLRFLSEIGMENIAAYLGRLSDKGLREFGDLGLLEPTVLARKEHSTIFNIAGNDQVYSKLREGNVICSRRGGGIRLSFHFYNTENEIDKIVKILKRN